MRGLINPGPVPHSHNTRICYPWAGCVRTAYPLILDVSLQTSLEVDFLGDRYMCSCTSNAHVKLTTVTATLPRVVGDLRGFEVLFFLVTICTCLFWGGHNLILRSAGIAISHTPPKLPCTQISCLSSSREVVIVVLLLSQSSRAHRCRTSFVCAVSAARWVV